MKTVLGQSADLRPLGQGRWGEAFLLEDASGQAPLRVEIEALQPAPEDVRGFVSSVLSRCSAGEIMPPAEGPARLKTATGYVLQAFETQVYEAGKLKELRIVAFYEFLSFMSVVTISAHDPQALGRQRERILQLLRSARPDFAGQGIAALSELWQ